MVMSYVEGITFERYLENQGGLIDFDRAVEILMPVMDALREVHEVGFLHRDISPDNMIISKIGRVVLIDFGAAREEMRGVSKSMSVVLKKGYAPEEQYRSRGLQGPWTDVYAVGATLYRAVTGKVPPEALDRLAEESIIAPSGFGITIPPGKEKVLLKALALRKDDRFRSMSDFQSGLLSVDKPVASAEQRKHTSERAIVKKKILEEKAVKKKTSSNKPTKQKKTAPKQYSAKSGIHEKKNGVNPKIAHYWNNYRGAIFITAFLVILSIISVALNSMQTVNLDADYYIDYENGTIPIGDLPIGARVVDPTWEWEFRTGNDYAREAGDETRPVTWIVVAKDHYDGLEPHVTLLSEELIGKHLFDNSTNRGHIRGSNYWGDSGTANATQGLRPWLNSTGIHAGEGFHRAFSENFEGVVLATTLPNKEWENGNSYSTQDYVFIPSITELGDSDHNYTYQIGTAYAYFDGAGDAKRVARLDGETRWYWTRSPVSRCGSIVRYVSGAGEFYYDSGAYDGITAVRPALNLKSGILVSEINH